MSSQCRPHPLIYRVPNTAHLPSLVFTSAVAVRSSIYCSADQIAELAPPATCASMP